MFQNISFTFLCALAFISWSLLCYLDAVDDHQIHNDYKVELYTERPTFADVPKYCTIESTDYSMILRIFDMVVTYSLILVATIAISKGLQWLELQMTVHMQESLANIRIRILPFMKYVPIELVEDDNKDVIIEEKDETVELESVPQIEDECSVGQKWPTDEYWEMEEKCAMGDKWQIQDKWTTEENWETREDDIELQQKWNDDTNMPNENLNGAEYMETQSNMGGWQNWENFQTEESASSQLPQCHQENMELKEQLNDLQERCRELLQELRAVNQNKSSCIELHPNPSESSFGSSDDSSGVIMWKKPVVHSSSGLSIASTPDSVSHNVYVTHSHYHINFNGPVQLTKQDINVDMSSTKKLRRRSEFLQVWGTFIKGPEKHPMLTGINNILI